MPKDLIHFKVAMLTADKLGDTRFAPCLASNRPGLLLGSVFHDGLFYAVTRLARPLEPLAHQLHGTDGRDTYRLIRLQAAHAAVAEDRDLATALLAGMVSHLFTDAVLHPLVWYFSGHYYADAPRKKSLARQRHRALESLLDMIFCPEMIGRPLFSLRRLLRSVGSSLFDALPVNGLADDAGVPTGTARTGLRSALNVHALFQAAYPITPLARLLFALSPVLPNSAREIAALFYSPQLATQAEPLRGDIAYSHPVTGKPTSESIPAMMDRAANLTAAVCRRLEGAVFRGEKPNLPENGPSLDAGLSGTPTDAMRHFANPPFPELP